MQVSRLVFLAATHFAVTFAHLNVDFCSVPNCRFGTHVMCQYTQPGGDSECGVGHKPYPLTWRQKSDLLDWHNKVRSQVAIGKGQEYGGGFPQSVGNMRALSWSWELEQYAQRWADQCNLVLELEHDECRNTIRTNAMAGQNVFSQPFSTQMDTIDSSLETLKREWTSGPLVIPNGTEILSHSSAKALQVVWPAANTLGCGQSHFTNGSHRIALVVCNYGTGVDFKTGSPRFGPNCSACPDGSNCSNTYHGLCASASHQNAVKLLVALSLAAYMAGKIWD